MKQESSLDEGIELCEAGEEGAHDLVLDFEFALRDHEHEEGRHLLLVPLWDH